MHVAPNLHEALLHTKKLLAKNGRFLLQEIDSGKHLRLFAYVKSPF